MTQTLRKLVTFDEFIARYPENSDVKSGAIAVARVTTVVVTPPAASIARIEQPSYFEMLNHTAVNPEPRTPAQVAKACRNV